MAKKEIVFSNPGALCALFRGVPPSSGKLQATLVASPQVMPPQPVCTRSALHLAPARCTIGQRTACGSLGDGCTALRNASAHALMRAVPAPAHTQFIICTFWSQNVRGLCNSYVLEKHRPKHRNQNIGLQNVQVMPYVLASLSRCEQLSS